MCETVESCRSPITNLIRLLCIGLAALLAAAWTTRSASRRSIYQARNSSS